MDKEQWLEAARIVLEDIFKQVKEFGEPICTPLDENDRKSFWSKHPQQRQAAARLRGLAGSFLAAAPLLRDDPEAEAGGYSLREYYKSQIKRCAAPEFMRCLHDVEGMPEVIAQNARGCAALCFGLALCKKAVWDSYTKEERDQIAGLCSSFDTFADARGSRVSQNISIMLMLAFLNREGYPADPDAMRDLAQTVLSNYAGDGWYREGKAFDCDSFWALQVFGPLWNRWYGYECEPYIAWKLEEYSNTLVKTLPSLFDKEGRSPRWGNGQVCTSAAAAPLAANFFLNRPEGDPGLARTVVSRALVHSLAGREYFNSTIFFFCLAFPDGHPFWTAPGSEGVWGETRKEAGKETGKETVRDRQEKTDGGKDEIKDKIKETMLSGPGVIATNYGCCGFTDLRTAKVLLEREDADLRAYSRLSFNSRYPWEDFDMAGAEAMQYCLSRDGEDSVQIPNLILSGGYREQVLYRKAYFDFMSCIQDAPSIGLADFPVANGLVRVDRVHIPGGPKPYTLTLGAYGMPARGRISTERREKDGARALILSSGEEQLAFVTYAGFDDIEMKQRQGVNPIARDSILMYGICRKEQNRGENRGCREYGLVSAVLQKKGSGRWSDEELFPIRRLRFGDRRQQGGCGPISLSLRDGRSICVDFEALDGQLSI